MFRVAFYRGDEFQGVICGSLGRLEYPDADIIAQRYNAAYPYHNGRYIPVEMTDTGCILRIL
jgi:hypothetical protein